MRNIISSQLEIGQVYIANIGIDVTSRDDIPLILLGLKHIYTTKPLKEAVFNILQEVVPSSLKKTVMKRLLRLWTEVVPGHGAMEHSGIRHLAAGTRRRL